jgi:transposase
MVEFSELTGLKIHLVYYPPYHSKYNPIERCWSALEQYWNGTILDSIDKALKWAKNMKWKEHPPTVHFVEKIYKKGISLTKKELKEYAMRFQRSDKLPKWDIVIEPPNA